LKSGPYTKVLISGRDRVCGLRADAADCVTARSSWSVDLSDRDYVDFGIRSMGSCWLYNTYLILLDSEGYTYRKGPAFCGATEVLPDFPIKSLNLYCPVTTSGELRCRYSGSSFEYVVPTYLPEF
jgi:hypothetical protein